MFFFLIRYKSTATKEKDAPKSMLVLGCHFKSDLYKNKFIYCLCALKLNFEKSINTSNMSRKYKN